MSIILIGAFACIFTFLGGLFALKYKDKLHLIFGFTAGAILGVAFFDLIPEAIDLAGDTFETKYIVSVVCFGFLLYMLIDRFVISHHHKAGEYCECENDEIYDLEDCEDCECDCGHEDENEHEHEDSHIHDENHQRRGSIGALSLSVHSFLDGISIGIAFQVSQAVGIVVAVAVLIHDFSDGLNTVNMILKNNGERRQALKWLAVDAIAPVLGVVATLFFTIQKTALGLILAMFAGFFIYLASSNMIPESHHSHSTKWTTVMTIFGALVMYIAINLANF